MFGKRDMNVTGEENRDPNKVVEFGIPRGAKCRDNVTGFTGVCAAQLVFLHGCQRILIEPDTLDEKGNPREPQWFDEQRVELVQESEPEVSAENKSPTGGPATPPDPTRGAPTS